MHTDVITPELHVTPIEWVNTQGLLPADVVAGLYEYARYLQLETHPESDPDEYPVITREAVLEAMRTAHESDDPLHMVDTIGQFTIAASLEQLARLGGFDSYDYNTANGDGAAKAAVQQVRLIRGVEEPANGIDITELTAKLRAQLDAGAVDERARIATSDEPIELFLFGGTSKQLRGMHDQAIELIRKSDLVTSDAFATIIRPYLAPEFREGEGWERARAAIIGYQRRYANEYARKHEAWLDEHRQPWLARAVRRALESVVQLVPGVPADTKPKGSDPDAWTL